MAERTECVQMPDGTMEVYIACPDGPGPFPVIIQLMDGIGMREELRGHARRTAAPLMVKVTVACRSRRKKP